MGGEDDESNYTYLTIKQHIIAHFLLWKIHRNVNDLRSMHMLGANLSVEYRRKIGQWCAENKVGFHSDKWSQEQKDEWRKKGLETQKESGSNDTFYYWSTEEGRKKRASMGGTVSCKTNEKWKYWHSPEGRKKRASLGGQSHKGKRCMYKPGDTSFKRVKPEDIDDMISQGYIFGSPYTPHNKH